MSEEEKFARRYGMEELLDCLERNEKAGIVYHREGIMGDYDDFEDEEELFFKSNDGELMVREIKENELNKLLELYLYLHEDTIPEMTKHLKNTWETIVKDDNHHIVVNEIDGIIVSSCVCVIIPNLTRGIRPYAFIENVVTHNDYRERGYATECLNYAKDIAMKCNCYKMMLLTGSKKDKTLKFYEGAGYNSSDKTAFIQWLD